MPCTWCAAGSWPRLFFPLDDLQRLHETIIREILEEILPSRRLRANPRAVKRKMSKFPIKRHTQRYPQPHLPPERAVRIVA